MQDTKEFELINEQFPRIGKSLAAVWGTEECHNYLHKLLFDTRDGSRKGFPKDVAGAILKLQTKHRTDFPYYGKDAKDIWNGDLSA